MLLVFGSLNVDLVFAVERLPRPGETVLTDGYARLPGGKGANQAAAAAKAGAAVRMAGAVGDDGLAAVATAGLLASGVDLRLVRSVTAPTGVAMIGVDARGENSIIVASGANATVRAGDVADAELAAATTLLLQNEVPFEASRELARRARALGVRVVWNLAPAQALSADDLASIDVLVVNRGELATVARTDASPLEQARGIAWHSGAAVVVTLGAEGALLVTASAATRIPTLAVAVVDTTGAGDAFAGVLAAALDRGSDLAAGARWAAVAGALACTALGAQAAQPSEAAIMHALPDLAPSEPLQT